MSLILNPTINAHLKIHWKKYCESRFVSSVCDEDYEAAKEVFIRIGYGNSEFCIRKRKSEQREFSKEEFIKEYWGETQKNIQDFIIDNRHILFTYLAQGVPFSKIKTGLSKKLFSYAPTDGTSFILAEALSHPMITEEDWNELTGNTFGKQSLNDAIVLARIFKNMMN